MASRDHTLLREIEGDLLVDKPLAGILRKVIVLGGRAGSGELRDWASLELQGYAGSEHPIPDYRHVGAQIRADAVSMAWQMSGQSISTSDLPDFAQDTISEHVELPFAVAELESAAGDPSHADDPLKLALPMSVELARVMTAQGRVRDGVTVTALYWAVSRQSIVGVIDRIRTKLAELVAELIATMPPDQTDPSPEQAAAAVQFLVTGKRNTVSIATAQAAPGGTATASPATPPGATDDDPAWWTLGRTIGAFIVGLAVVATGVLTYLLYIKG